NLSINDGAVFNNLAAGVFEVHNNQFLQSTLIGTPGSFVNAGIFRKSAAATGTTDIAGLSFSNTGTLEVQGGRLDFSDELNSAGSVPVQAGTLGVPGGYRQSAGSTIVEGTLTASSVDIQGGTLSGTGTIIADVSNSAQVMPGLSPGVLTINGNYTQSQTGGL